ETAHSQIHGIFHIHRDTSSSSHPAQAITRGVTHKARLYGQTHWINVVALQFHSVDIIEPYLKAANESSRAFAGMQRCKALARNVKSQRTPPWPCPLTAQLPARSVADALVDGYLRTTETVYRVLHIPTFRSEYETLWASPGSPDPGFLAQLKLVLAIGAVTLDATFSLRDAATRWVLEAQTWLSHPKYKSRLGIACLQTDLLLLIARELVGAGGEPVWVSSGALLRKAMQQGLHRDPTHIPGRTTLAVEMHRRVWHTVLELALQASMTSGGPPLISLDDFDTAPPGDFDDEQLLVAEPVPSLDEAFTQMSVARALWTTFPSRLAVAKFLNDLVSVGTYEEALRLDAALKASLKDLRRLLRGAEVAGGAPKFEILAVQFVMHRYVSALHVAFFGPSLQEATYAFSRNAVIETSLKIWRAANPVLPMDSHSGEQATSEQDLARLVLCGSGFYRTVAIQAALLVAVEMKAQLEEQQESFGPVLLRPDLVSVLEDSRDWCLRCMKAGETNAKGHLLVSALLAQIDAIRRGLSGVEMIAEVVKAAEDSGNEAVVVLEEMVARGRGEGPGDVSQPMPLDLSSGAEMELPLEAIDDWDFMVSERFLVGASTANVTRCQIPSLASAKGSRTGFDDYPAGMCSLSLERSDKARGRFFVDVWVVMREGGDGENSRLRCSCQTESDFANLEAGPAR
ncbi:hypothetical protein B0H67DRAFT_495923, partial [Lasiosphaeris hirsuta]